MYVVDDDPDSYHLSIRCTQLDEAAEDAQHFCPVLCEWSSLWCPAWASWTCQGHGKVKWTGLDLGCRSSKGRSWIIMWRGCCMFVSEMRQMLSMSCCINPLWPWTTWHCRLGSTSTQVMAWCLMAPSHYLNWCWTDNHLNLRWLLINRGYPAKRALPAMLTHGR